MLPRGLSCLWSRQVYLPVTRVMTEKNINADMQRGKRMKKTDEVKKLLEDIVNETVKESSKSKNTRVEVPLPTKYVLQMVLDINQEIEQQIEHLEKMEERIKRVDERFKLLVQKLVVSGYIKSGERRKVLKRNTLTQEALINLLEKKRVVSKRGLIEEIKKLQKNKP
jgi:hypothetical protein